MEAVEALTLSGSIFCSRAFDSDPSSGALTISAWYCAVVRSS